MPIARRNPFIIGMSDSIECQHFRVSYPLKARPRIVMEGIVRVQDGAVALRLDLPGIPLATIPDEQRFLRATFPVHG